MRSDSLILGCVSLLVGGLASSVMAERMPDTAPSRADILYANEPGPLLRAEVRFDRPILQSGQPVWAELSLTNLTDNAMTLQVPDAEPSDKPRTEMGLPLSHVFSGKGFSGVTVRDTHGDSLDDQVTRKPLGPVPVVHLAARGSVGIRVDLARYYEVLLRRPGKYTVLWRPYGATVESAPATITLLPEQQAIILTDHGRMIVRFYFDQAPRHVQNFLDLVSQRFYDNLTFHRVVPGYIIQGGDPRGDGKGIRADGKKLVAEFSRIPFDLGTVGMARSPRDPDSASCQFFICLGRQAAFDGEQTAFGYLVGQESFDTLAKIAAVPTAGPKDRPVKSVFIRAVSLDEVPQRDREPLGITNSPGSRPSTADRALEPAWQKRGSAVTPVHHEGEATPVDSSPARRLARASRLVASTQPTGAGRE